MKEFREIFSFSEDLTKMVVCPMCVGFWVGGFLRYGRVGPDLYEMLLYAAIGSITSFTWFLLMKRLMDKYG